MKTFAKIALVLLMGAAVVSTVAACNPFAPGQIKKEAKR